MATRTVEVGHIVIGETGAILRADAGFCAIMRAACDAMVGQRLLALTAPEDRAVCGDLMQSLRRSRRPFRIAKRMLRPDGTRVWVDKTVGIADFGTDDPTVPPLIVATIVPIDNPERLEDPARLLAMAHFLQESRRAQAMLFGVDFPVDVAWDLLLAIYVAEARGESSVLATLADNARVTRPVASRWLLALDARGLVEAEGDRAFRLTVSGHSRIEAYLANRILKMPTSIAGGDA